jgi:hypothetical protein
MLGVIDVSFLLCFVNIRVTQVIFVGVNCVCSYEVQCSTEGFCCGNLYKEEIP